MGQLRRNARHIRSFNNASSIHAAQQAAQKSNWKRDFFALLPGTNAHMAMQKRKLEQALRAQGYSQREAVAIASRHFAKDIDADEKQT